jgi:glyoxylase-like metal-dependent hydrolase (beta-lactamase superfamily II)
MSDPTTVQTFQVGDLTISRVPETVLSAFAPDALLPRWDAERVQEHLNCLIPGSLDHAGRQVILSTHAWLVRSPKHTILIDTGIGNDKLRPAPAFHQLKTPFLARLQEAGASPGDIDYVLLTHLHSDHVGWNTQFVEGRWVPTFRKAQYVFSRIEYEALNALSQSGADPRGFFEDSVQPIVAAGQARLADPEQAASLDNLTLHPTPGHSIDHWSISMSSRGETAFFAGDVMHHPVQLYQPAWSSIFCESPEDAQKSRMWALQFAADNDALLFSSHFAESSAGRIRRRRGGYSWQFA